MAGKGGKTQLSPMITVDHWPTVPPSNTYNTSNTGDVGPQAGWGYSNALAIITVNRRMPEIESHLRDYNEGLSNTNIYRGYIGNIEK